MKVNFLIKALLPIFLLSACAPQISFLVQRPAEFQLKNVKFLEIGGIREKSGSIPLPGLRAGEQSAFNKLGIHGKGAPLQPTVAKFDSDLSQAKQTAGLVRAQMVDGLSENSPLLLINTTGEETGFSASIPDESQIAVLEGNLKYAEIRMESGEDFAFMVSVKNKGTSLEQQLLATAGSVGAETLGAGFKLPTPYVEVLAAIEIEMTLKRKTGELLVPPQKHRAYYVRKWGGSPGTSHMPWPIKAQIIRDYQEVEKNVKALVSELDRTVLAVQDPAEYLSRGLNLRRHQQVPLTSLDLKIRLAKQVSGEFIKQISPHQESAELEIQSGNPVAANLIRGNAYEEAVAYLLNLDERSPEDEFNLGLAYEADGSPALALPHYQAALDRDPGKALYQATVNRFK